MGDEYPKVIKTGGITVTVCDADDEARWRSAPPAGDPVVAVEAVALVEPEPAAPAPVVDAAPKRRKSSGPRVPGTPKKKAVKKKP